MKELESLNKLIEVLQEYPTIGKKSATRLAISIAKDKFKTLKLINALEEVVTNIKECELCGNFSEDEICYICDSNREKIVAIVSSQKDTLVMEEAKIFDGYYFVLDSLDEEKIEKLKEYIKNKEIKEVLFAFSPTLENEAKILYLQDKLKDLNIEFSQIAQGVPTGVSFENIDIQSLSKALKQRIKME